jgi:hypothetical protein
MNSRAALSRVAKLLSGRLRIPLLFVLFLGLLASRRWAQLAHPQVWDEEGMFISGPIANGWADFLQPVNGYLLLVPKAIARASLALSYYQYPLVSTIATWLFIASVGLAVALAPTSLRGRWLCAMAVFFVPTDPEVFGLTLYTFWWASILVILLPLWDETKPWLWLRLGFVLAGGLSSPVVIAVLPMLYLRAFIYRARRSELVVALAATAVAVVQLHFTIGGSAASAPPVGSILRNVIPKFSGYFLVANLWETSGFGFLAGALLVGLIVMWLLSDRRDMATWMLAALWATAIAMSVARVNPAYIHPRTAGPRYFFLPYALTFWILVQCLYAAPRRWLRWAAVAAIGCAILNAAPVWSRKHYDLHWTDHVRSAPLFPEYEIPIHTDGRSLDLWSIREPQAVWSALLRSGAIDSPEQEAGPTFPYRVLNTLDDAGQEESIFVVRSPKGGAWAQKLDLGEGRSVVSRPAPGGARREVLLRLRLGDQLRLPPGSVEGIRWMEIVGSEGAFIRRPPVTKDGVWLEFSNRLLPTFFTVRIDEEGAGDGLWSALAAGGAGGVSIGRKIDGTFEIGASPQVWRNQAVLPHDQTTIPGGLATFAVGEVGHAKLQWRHDNVDLADGAADGATIVGSRGPQLLLTHVRPQAAGRYACVFTNRLGLPATYQANLFVAKGIVPGALGPVSVRGFVGKGSGSLQYTFRLAGERFRAVLIEAIGPGLAGSMSGGFLPGTSLQLNNSKGPMYRNTGWMTGGNGPEIHAAALASFGSARLATGDSALLVMLPPGDYTVLVSGEGGATGTALLEMTQLP